MSQRRRCKRGHDPYMDQWHRAESVQRFIDRLRAQWLTQIDIDSCEYCFLGGCLQPVALIETKLIWSVDKTITVTQNLAKRAGIPAYLVEYETTLPTAKCDTCHQPVAVEGNDIEYFIITGPDGPLPEKDPAKYAEWLWELRFDHWRNECTNPAREKMLNFLTDARED